MRIVGSLALGLIIWVPVELAEAVSPRYPYDDGLQLVEDFEGINAVDQWNIERLEVPGLTPYINIEDDPIDPSNGKVLGVLAENTFWGNISFVLDLGDRALVNDPENPRLQTLYFRLFRPEVVTDSGPILPQLDVTFGLVSSEEFFRFVPDRELEDIGPFPSWGAYASIVRYSGVEPLDIRDGANGYKDSEPLGPSEAGVWYQIWMVHDMADRSYQVYAQGGSDYPVKTLLTKEYAPVTTEQTGEVIFEGDQAKYRVDSSSPLDWFMIRYSSNLEGSRGIHNVYIDDIAIGSEPIEWSRPEFTNVSMRGVVKEGSEAFSTAITVSGNTYMNVLIQAVGQELVGVERSGLTSDDVVGGATIRLVNSRSEELVSSNWEDQANADDMIKAALEVGGTPLETGSGSAAMLLNLGPGIYTALVDGAGSEGIVLLEAYAVPENTYETESFPIQPRPVYYKLIDDFEGEDPLSNWSTTTPAEGEATSPAYMEIRDDPINSGQGKVLAIVPGEEGHLSFIRELGEDAFEYDSENPHMLNTLRFKVLVPMVDVGERLLPGLVDVTLGMLGSEGTIGEPTWGHYASVVRWAFGEPLTIRDGDSYRDSKPLGPNEVDVWYEISMVHDIAENTYSVYADGGTNFPWKTLLTEEYVIISTNDGEDDSIIFEGDEAEFRNKSLSALDQFMIRYSSGPSRGLDPLYIDDIYIDYTYAKIVDSNTVGADEDVFMAAPPVESKLVSIVAHGIVEDETRLLIGGFVIEGTEPVDVYIQALGEELVGLGGLEVTADEVLKDPRIRLVRSGNVVRENDDWESEIDAEELAAISWNWGFKAPETESKSAVVLANLTPGTYTVVVDGKGDEGVVLLEIYHLDEGW